MADNEVTSALADILADRQRKCKHTLVQPTFDYEEAKRLNLTAHEVKKRWPRFFGDCPTCGQSLILYASNEHYIYGDW